MVNINIKIPLYYSGFNKYYMIPSLYVTLAQKKVRERYSGHHLNSHINLSTFFIFVDLHSILLQH